MTHSYTLVSKLHKMALFGENNSNNNGNNNITPEEKPEYGCLLRRNPHATLTSKSSSNSRNPKGFEDYYRKKMITKDNSSEFSRLNTIETSQSAKNDNYFSLANSRANSLSSLHKTTKIHNHNNNKSQ